MGLELNLDFWKRFFESFGLKIDDGMNIFCVLCSMAVWFPFVHTL